MGQLPTDTETWGPNTVTQPYHQANAIDKPVQLHSRYVTAPNRFYKTTAVRSHGSFRRSCVSFFVGLVVASLVAISIYFGKLAIHQTDEVQRLKLECLKLGQNLDFVIEISLQYATSITGPNIMEGELEETIITENKWRKLIGRFDMCFDEDTKTNDMSRYNSTNSENVDLNCMKRKLADMMALLMFRENKTLHSTDSL